MSSAPASRAPMAAASGHLSAATVDAFARYIIAEQESKPRPFSVEVRVLQMEPAALRERIDRRVDQMMADGLLDEVRSLMPYRHLNTLNTVGYRELFPVIEGNGTLEDAVATIKLNTWHYARKQLTWCRRYQYL